jgi:hypothetical protein
MDEKKETNSSSASFQSKEEIAHQEQAPFVSSEAEKKLYRKLNIRFVPFLAVILFLQVKTHTNIKLYRKL